MAKYLGFPKIPRIDQAAMKKTLQESARAIGTDIISAMSQAFSNQETNTDISVECLIVLKALADALPPYNYLSASELAYKLRMTEQRLQYFLDSLLEKELIHDRLVSGQLPTYSLKPEGRKVLFERHFI